MLKLESASTSQPFTLQNLTQAPKVTAGTLFTISLQTHSWLFPTMCGWSGAEAIFHSMKLVGQPYGRGDLAALRLVIHYGPNISQFQGQTIFKASPGCSVKLFWSFIHMFVDAKQFHKNYSWCFSFLRLNILNIILGVSLMSYLFWVSMGDCPSLH